MLEVIPQTASPGGGVCAVLLGWPWHAPAVPDAAAAAAAADAALSRTHSKVCTSRHL